jgi:hypothetical protein
MGNIVAAIKARYNNPAEIDSIDIGFIGSYGEWNFSGTSPQVSYPAAAEMSGGHRSGLSMVPTRTNRMTGPACG